MQVSEKVLSWSFTEKKEKEKKEGSWRTPTSVESNEKCTYPRTEQSSESTNYDPLIIPNKKNEVSSFVSPVLCIYFHAVKRP